MEQDSQVAPMLQEDEMIHDGFRRVSTGDQGWYQRLKAVIAFIGIPFGSDPQGRCHQECMALLMTIGRRTDDLTDKLQSVVDHSESLVEQNKAMTAVLRELFEVVKQQPSRGPGNSSIHKVRGNTATSMGDLQTDMTAEGGSKRKPNSTQVVPFAHRAPADQANTSRSKEQDVNELFDNMKKAIQQVTGDEGLTVLSRTQRRRVFALMKKNGSFPDTTPRGWTFSQLVDEARKRSLTGIDQRDEGTVRHDSIEVIALASPANAAC